MSTREIVNGGLLAHSQGRKVCIFGNINNVNSDGMSFNMETIDKMTVTVNLPSAVDDMLDGYVEVLGTVQSRNTIKADEYIQFSPEQFEGFDADGYNKLCGLFQKVKDVYKIC